MLNGAGWLVGHVSAFPIPAAPALRTYGIGDLVVKPRYRGRGIAACLAEAVVSECARRSAELVVVDTAAAERQFAALGFEAARPWSVFYVSDGVCRRHPHWMVRWAVEPVARVELLAHGDF